MGNEIESPEIVEACVIWFGHLNYKKGKIKMIQRNEMNYVKNLKFLYKSNRGKGIETPLNK